MRPEDDRQPALALGEERQPDQPEQDVQRDRDEPAPEPERAADEQHAEGLAGDRDRAAGIGMYDLRRQVDEQRAGDDEGDVADPCVEALADADGDQEIGDREPAFRGRRAVEAGDRDRQSRLRCGGHRPVTVAPSLASRHSYWTARTIDRRLASRAG